jgi:hypothetical protein
LMAVLYAKSIDTVLVIVGTVVALSLDDRVAICQSSAKGVRSMIGTSKIAAVAIPIQILFTGNIDLKERLLSIDYYIIQLNEIKSIDLPDVARNCVKCVVRIKSESSQVLSLSNRSRLS